MGVGGRPFLLVNDYYGYRVDRVVDVTAGATTTLSVVVPPAVLHVTSDTPADVVLDGRPLGRTPLTNVSVSVGIHELVLTSSTVGEQRYTIAARAGTNRLRASFADLVSKAPKASAQRRTRR
jgi:hypothetical protein